MLSDERLLDRELSWLAFNERVLTLAADPALPLLERVAFCAIFGTNLGSLRRLNNIVADSEIQGGTVLVVPRISADAREKNRAKAKSKLQSSGPDQKDGELMIVAVPDKDATIAGKKRVFYRVVAGDSLRAIAKALGVDKDDLARWSSLAPDGKLHPKMILVAWVPTNFDADKKKITLLDEAHLAVVTRGSPEHLDLQEQRTGRSRMEYVATGSEKLADIAKRFGMGPYDLGRINRIPYNTVLKKGEKIIVYQVADPSRSARAAEQWSKTPRGRRGTVPGKRAIDTASAPRDGKAAEGDAKSIGKTTPAKQAEDDDHEESVPPPSAGGPVTKPTQVE